MDFYVCRTFYDYFGGEKRESTKHVNLLAGWEAFKKGRAHDFDYGDAFQRTTYTIRHDYTAQNKPQRPHARSLYAWKKMCEEKAEQDFRNSHMGFSKMEYDFLLSLTEDIII